MDIRKIEQQRQQLEHNVLKLEKSLRHWQLWEAEYEGLREEVDALPDSSSADDLLVISREYGGDLVTEAEILEIFGIKKTPRSPKQASGLLSRRIDYVHQNVDSITRQLDRAREELDPSGHVIQTGMQNDEGQAMMEIVEELDDDGNVVSSKLSKPGESADAVLESLKKAGMSEKDWIDASALPSEQSPDEEQDDSPKSTEAKDAAFVDRANGDDAGPTKAEQGQKRKAVSFAADTKSEPESTHEPGSKAQPELSELLRGSFSQNERVWQLDDNENAFDYSSPHIPIDESPEDAALRRQMLQYNMNEVGAVVAQMDLEEFGSSDEDSYDYDEDEMSEASDDEEEHGMSVRSTISSKYRDEMQQLEEKLNASILQNVGPELQAVPRDVDTSALNAAEDADYDEDVKDRTDSGKKSVRFSEDLDIAPLKPSANGKSAESGKPSAPPMHDTVLERSQSSSSAQAQNTPPQKVSRFKGSRQEMSGASKLVQRQDTPLADAVVERPMSTTAANVEAPDEDALHPEQLRRELAQDYYRHRNRLIKQQGGFLEEDADDQEVADEPPEQPVGEREAPKKVSRFMAARVKPDKIW